MLDLPEEEEESHPQPGGGPHQPSWLLLEPLLDFEDPLLPDLPEVKLEPHQPGGGPQEPTSWLLPLEEELLPDLLELLLLEEPQPS